MDDLLLHGGSLIDGTGRPAVRADVAVCDGLVSAVGPLPDRPALSTVDVTDLVICPGFVDLHTHSDLTLLSHPQASSKVRQGVTTEVVGNCGLGVAPLPAGVDIAAVRASAGYLDLDPSVELRWSGFDGYLGALDAARTSLNVAALVPHIPLRVATVGLDDRPAGPPERDRIRGLLGEALAAGAVGASTGLVYAPACFADEDELLTLGATVADHDALFAWHVRDYADGLLPSVAQAVRVAERTGCRTQISHLIAVGRRNWGRVVDALSLVDAANARGADIGVDVYPYLAGNAPLAQILPAWAQAGGAETMVARLVRPDVRRRVVDAWADLPWTWSEITVSRVPDASSPAAGRTLADLAATRGADPAEVALDLLVAYGGAVLVVSTGRTEEDLLSVLRHPATVIGSDGLAMDPDGPTGAGVPHPRSYGTYPRLLGRYAGVLDLPAAVAKCTSAPARRIGLRRGTVAPGWPADLVAFDPASIMDTATFTAPQRFPDGIALVVVNGEPTVDRTGHTGARAGRVLR